MINHDMKYEAGVKPTKLHKVTASLQPLFRSLVCYLWNDMIWCTNQLCTEFSESMHTQLLISCFYLMGPWAVGGWGGGGGVGCSLELVFHSVHLVMVVERLILSGWSCYLISIDYLQPLRWRLVPIYGRGLWLYSSANYPNPQWHHNALVGAMPAWHNAVIIQDNANTKLIW